MAKYPDLDDMDELWPEDGYAVIIEDEYKPPDSEDFLNVLDRFSSPDFELPESKESSSYWVHDADGSRYTRDEWRLHRAEWLLKEAVRKVCEDQPVEETLQRLKEKGQRWWQRDDVIWFEIVLSLSTLQGGYGSQVVVNGDGEIDEHRYGSLAFRTLEQVDPERRYEYLESRLYGNVAMQSTKAEAIESNFERVKEDFENPKGAKEAFMQLHGGKQKVKFLKQFDWIGDKYARNILMDLYLEDSRDYIAIDSRIKGILKEIGYPFEQREYEDHEEFLQTVARDLEMEPWELDRTLFNFQDEIQTAL